MSAPLGTRLKCHLVNFLVKLVNWLPWKKSCKSSFANLFLSAMMKALPLGSQRMISLVASSEITLCSWSGKNVLILSCSEREEESSEGTGVSLSSLMEDNEDDDVLIIDADASLVSRPVLDVLIFADLFNVAKVSAAIASMFIFM